MDLLLSLLLIPFAMPLALGFVSMCCCTVDCNIFADAFGTDNLATNYDTRAGTWSVSSGVLSTSSSNALLIANAAAPSNAGKFTIRVSSSTSGQEIRIVGAYVDDDNYLFGKITFGAFPATTTVGLWKRDAGVETQLGVNGTVSGLFASTLYTAVICWGSDRSSITFNGMTRSHKSYVPAGDQAGVGSGSLSGSLTFDDLDYDKHLDDGATCPACTSYSLCGSATVGACEDGSQPVTGTVVLTNLANGTCSSCSSYDGTYVISATATQQCIGSLDFTNAACVVGTHNVRYLWSAPTTLTVDWAAALNFPQWSMSTASLGTPGDCRTLSGPLTLTGGGGGGCTVGGSTTLTLEFAF
jgi:hypothetical protein